VRADGLLSLLGARVDHPGAGNTGEFGHVAILLITGFMAKIAIVWTIGIIVLLIGVILAVLGMVGHAVGGRKHYY
jgi:Family of unknown function (DUF6131)